MRIFLSMLLLGAMATVSVSAQNTPPERSGHFEVAVTYGAMLSNVTSSGSFWMQGGSIQVHGEFYRGLGIVADVAGLHTNNINASGVGLDLVTATFGPRYTWSPAHHRFALYGQALAGEANGFHSLFPQRAGPETGDDSLALQVGGGMNVILARHLAVRAIEADWVRTQLPNGTTNVQNNIRLGAGVVFRFQ